MTKHFIFTFLSVAMQLAPFAIARAEDQIINLCQFQDRTFGQVGNHRYVNELTIVGKAPGENLPGSYEPEDLMMIPMERISPAIRDDLISEKRSERLRRKAAIALDRMILDASKDNIELFVHSAYRTYKFQCHVFSTKLRNELETTSLSLDDAINSVNTRSAIPGQSEHQLGTVADITTNIPGEGYQLIYQMMDTPAYKWLQDNAYKYGYVMSYPYSPEVALNETNPKTGYVFEPWHWRYIHPHYANIFRQCGDMTLREFLYRLAQKPKFTCR
ncbi:MAG: D-alanyl-D-alanine carboxypeptidase family protein [Bacillota bacterium]